MRDAQTALEELSTDDEDFVAVDEPVEEAVAFAPEPEIEAFESEPTDSDYDPELVPKFDPNFEDAFDAPTPAPAPSGGRDSQDGWAPVDLGSGAEVVSDWPTEAPKSAPKMDDVWAASTPPAPSRPVAPAPTPRPQSKSQADLEKIEQEREREQILLSTLHPEMASRARRMRRMNPEIAIDDVIARLKEQAEQEQRESGDDKRSSWWRRK